MSGKLGLKTIRKQQQAMLVTVCVSVQTMLC